MSKDEQLNAIRHYITEAIEMLTKPECTNLRQPEWLRPENVIEKLKEAMEESE